MGIFGGGAPTQDQIAQMTAQAYAPRKAGIWDYIAGGLNGASPSQVDGIFARGNLQRLQTMQSMAAMQNWNNQFAMPGAQGQAPQGSPQVQGAPVDPSVSGAVNSLLSDPGTAASQGGVVPTQYTPQMGGPSSAPLTGAPGADGTLPGDSFNGPQGGAGAPVGGVVGGLLGGGAPSGAPGQGQAQGQAPRANADDPMTGAVNPLQGVQSPLPQATSLGASSGGSNAIAPSANAGGQGAPQGLNLDAFLPRQAPQAPAGASPTASIPGSVQTPRGTFVLDENGHFRPLADLAPRFAQAMALGIPGAKEQWAAVTAAADYDKPHYTYVNGVGMVDDRHGSVDPSIQSNEVAYGPGGVPYYKFANKLPSDQPTIGPNQQYRYDSQGHVIGTEAIPGAARAVGEVETAKADAQNISQARRTFSTRVINGVPQTKSNYDWSLIDGGTAETPAANLAGDQTDTVAGVNLLGTGQDGYVKASNQALQYDTALADSRRIPTGPGTKTWAGLGRIAQALHIATPDLARYSNDAAGLDAHLTGLTLPMAKELGANPSNHDAEIIQKANGSITTPQTVLQNGLATQAALSRKQAAYNQFLINYSGDDRKRSTIQKAWANSPDAKRSIFQDQAFQGLSLDGKPAVIQAQGIHNGKPISLGVYRPGTPYQQVFQWVN